MRDGRIERTEKAQGRWQVRHHGMQGNEWGRGATVDKEETKAKPHIWHMVSTKSNHMYEERRHTT